MGQGEFFYIRSVGGTRRPPGHFRKSVFLLHLHSVALLRYSRSKEKRLLFKPKLRLRCRPKEENSTQVAVFIGSDGMPWVLLSHLNEIAPSPQKGQQNGQFFFVDWFGQAPPAW
jgi:hypothetical protein